MEDKIKKIVNLVHSIHEEGVVLGSSALTPTNSLSHGQIAGTAEAGDDPPVRKKKKYATSGKGSRKWWLQYLKKDK